MTRCCMIHLQKCLYFNCYLYYVWVPVVGIFLFAKFHYNVLGHLTKYLALTVYTLLLFLEGARLYLGQYGNLSCRVPELAGFLMLSLLMQLPLISFFLFNVYLMNNPTEVTLHALLWSVTFIEIILSFTTMKHASSLAKSIYFSHYMNKDK